MPQILTKPFYADYVEHVFRLGVRQVKIRDETSAQWKTRFLGWFVTLPEEDKAFIREIFKYENRTTNGGLRSVGGDYWIGRKRLYALEKAFAIYTRIIDGGEDNEQ